MKILVDSRFSELTAVIDKSHNVIEVDVEDNVGIRSNTDDYLDSIVEHLYVMCVDNGIDTVISVENVCEKLELLGIVTIKIK